MESGYPARVAQLGGATLVALSALEVAERRLHPPEFPELRRALSLSRERLERALEESPGHPMAHFNLGLAMELSGQPERALGEYREALRFDPDLHKGRRHLTPLLRALGRDA